jgi:hypothetical protein
VEAATLITITTIPLLLSVVADFRPRHREEESGSEVVVVALLDSEEEEVEEVDGARYNGHPPRRRISG